MKTRNLTILAAAAIVLLTACNKSSSTGTRDFSATSANTIANTVTTTDVSTVKTEISTAGYIEVPLLGDDNETTYYKNTDNKHEFITIEIDDDTKAIDDVVYRILAPAGTIGTDYILTQVNTYNSLTNARFDDDDDYYIIDGTRATGTVYDKTSITSLSAFYNKLYEVFVTNGKYAVTSNSLSFALEVETASNNDYEILFSRPASFSDDAAVLAYKTGILGSLTSYEYIEIEAAVQ